MRAPLSRTNRSGELIGRHTVGNALVLYADERISPEAQSLALAVDEDADNDIVVLDLHGDMPVGIWESVAGALHRRRRGIRLVICGRHAEATVLAGQWLSDRLGRTVVTPHGHIIRGAASSLFVHAGAGSGWVRHRPGRPPTWEAKRFPRPSWDGAAAEFMPTSAVGAVEPLPAGVWIRDTGELGPLRDHWQWLVTALPCQPQALSVILGCPGTPPLPLDDIARFWRELDEEGRRRARFVHYGPVQVPLGESLGQALADLLRSQIVVFGGVPVGRPDRPQMHTVAPDGTLGWQVFARELSYTPRPRPTAPAAGPRMLSHRAPLVLGESIAPTIYRYAHDAVVEVLQSGLWMRSADAGRNADRIRARHADPEVHTLVFDDATEARAVRMKALGEDLIARLDPATRERSALVPASVALAAGSQTTARAGGRISEDETFRFRVADIVPERAGPTAEPVEPPVAPPTPALAPPTPALAPLTSVLAPPTSPLALAVPAAPAALRSLHRDVPTGTSAGPVHPAEQVQGFLRQPAETPAVPRSGSPASYDRPRHSAEERLRTDVAPGAAAPADPLAVLDPRPGPRSPLPPPVLPPPLPPPVLPPPLPPAEIPPAEIPAADIPAADIPAADIPAAEGPAATPVPEITAPRSQAAARLQTPPEPAASALPTALGLSHERDWLRRTLSHEFDDVASSISRVLSENPGLQGDFRTPGEILADAVAVRLYLSPLGDGLDAGLRSGTVGPHVPFARCVVAGLSHLPSHRGATVLAASPTRTQWHLLRRGRVLTEWGLLNALTAPSADLDGDVDVLVWSMTARRTRLLEPEGDGRVESRVIFLPGTSFKVLEVVDPGPGGRRGQVLIRELSADEIDAGGPVDADRVSFDDLATASLRRCAERWADVEPRTRVGAAVLARVNAVPGLVHEP